ncbi:hypothetical protein [Candidatus Uabimicrobium amorphum]|uniref:Uncharacterized protein n=1 Tax=Uabimicrobium amorphum TaxID=2596890 RepID=A0A5S9F305_UABAM|nr:hypothetical protein [Candidatus Uabimicrobium amorphum]BBM83761.1 hypothetical protein UABAM_02116 [Candidatus Uabimicrobium amorphum]
MLIFVLCGCGGGESVSTTGTNNVVDLSYQSSLNQSSVKKKTRKSSRSKSKKSRKPKKKAKSVVGSWETRDGNFHIQFSSGGKGVATRDRRYNGHLYTYYRDFSWKQKSSKILLKYTSETTIRDGVNIVREKSLSEKATFRISGNQLLRKGSSLYRK